MSVEVVALASAVIAASAVVVPVPDAFVVPAPAWCAAPAPATGYISQGAARVQWEECILRCCGVTAYAAASSKLPSVELFTPAPAVIEAPASVVERRCIRRSLLRQQRR